MPVVFIHGVYTRSPKQGIALEASFKKWFAPAIGNTTDLVYVPIFWGNHAAKFRWELKSRPRTVIRHAGAVSASTGLALAAPVALDSARAIAPAPTPAGPVIGGPAASASSTLSLATVKPEERGDVLADLYLAARHAHETTANPPPAPLPEEQVARLPFVAATVAETQWDAAPVDDKQRLSFLLQEVDKKITGVAAAGPNDWFSKIGEVAQRALSAPGDLVSTVFAELRPAANEFIANFIGDVLVYIRERGDKHAPGVIPELVLAGLREAKRKANGEPIVVLTHSMGGQLFYDAITHFVDDDLELKDIVIDDWISCGCQVSFFAELAQFIDQNPNAPAPAALKRPKRVRRWTNYYDENDLVGFIMKPVFGNDVEDVHYNTGYGLILAHTGFLQRPSFFETVAKQLAKNHVQ